MMIIAIVCAILFALTAGFLAILALRSYRRELAFGTKLGLPGQAVRASAKAWDDAHAAAAPFWGAAAVICTIQAVACGIAAFSSELLSSGYLWILLGVGVVLVGLLLFSARK